MRCMITKLKIRSCEKSCGYKLFLEIALEDKFDEKNFNILRNGDN